MNRTEIEYSEVYSDEKYEYRHAILPRSISKRLPDPMRLLTEKEWRGLGINQSFFWEHYLLHKPEPNVLLFRRLKGLKQPVPGDPEYEALLKQSR